VASQRQCCKQISRNWDVFSFSGRGKCQSAKTSSVPTKFLDLYQGGAWPVICILDGVLKQIRVGESGLENVVTKKGGLGNHENEFI
jgi:hypothetical protein